ncbi:MAG: M23 family metallopeptidase [Bacteroidota bacterium]|nr:M23 family metallopeptidase [Bacteroidota bacterium]
MIKIKYKLNKENLKYEKFTRTRFEWLIRSLGIFSILIISSFLLYIIVSNFFDTPKEKQLKREISNYELHFQLLNAKFQNLEKVVDNLEYRDENIYRIIFEAEPIPSGIRNAGYGGVEKYKNLEGYNNSRLIIKTTKKIDKLSKKLYILSKSFDDISKLATNKEEMLASIPAIQPISNKNLTRISSGFGWRIHPIYKVPKFHDGQDFTAPRGTDIYATGNGTIVEVHYSRRGYGNKIIIDHGFGYKTLYAHLSKFYVKKGQKIKRGEAIGTVGNTGLSTAPHLHYEVIRKGQHVNPINYFHNDLSPEDYEKVIILAEQANQSLD